MVVRSLRSSMLYGDGKVGKLGFVGLSMGDSGLWVERKHYNVSKGIDFNK
jgi:hypothetical protein